MLCLIITIIPPKDFIAMVQFGIVGFKEARARSEGGGLTGGEEEPDSQLSPFSSRASSMSDTRSLRGEGEEGAQHTSGESLNILLRK